MKILEDCYGCGLCAFSCPHGAISPVEGAFSYKVHPLRCNDCGICVPLCPLDVIVEDPEFAVCHGRGCPMSSSRLGGWECSEGRVLCLRCGSVLWKPPEAAEFMCPACQLELSLSCPKVKKLQSGTAA